MQLKPPNYRMDQAPPTPVAAPAGPPQGQPLDPRLAQLIASQLANPEVGARMTGFQSDLPMTLGEVYNQDLSMVAQAQGQAMIENSRAAAQAGPDGRTSRLTTVPQQERKLRRRELDFNLRNAIDAAPRVNEGS